MLLNKLCDILPTRFTISMAFFNTEWAATTSDYIVQNRTPTITSEEYIVGHQIHNVIASLCNFEPTITSKEYIAEHQITLHHHHM